LVIVLTLTSLCDLSELHGLWLEEMAKDSTTESQRPQRLHSPA